MADTTLENAATPPAILVVEDNYPTAMQVCDIVRQSGYAIVGPVARVKNGLEFLSGRPVDGAIVDINLSGTYSFPLCAELDRRKVPFSFLTAYRHTSIPPAFSGVPLLAKPADPAAIRAALAAMLPQRQVKPAPEPVRPLGNILLDGLTADDRAALEPYLEQGRLHAGDILERPEVPAAHLVFPVSGLLSMEAGTGRNRVEVAMVGREGMAGCSLLVGGAAAYTVMVQYDGVALTLPPLPLRELMARNHRLRERLLRGVSGLIGQISSNALAAARRTIEQRVARWLLMATERLQSSEIAVTHDDLARMLGVRRAGVTLALHMLEGEAALRSKRCRVHILDRARLSELNGG